ncbi:uncharacterized protein L684 [Acanthamoeba castellanii mimivirus]|uniref:Uncharacterized protein L684 n=6 Tax=Mimivirus TaxID=315393 RepID=YL684_MIMIV|nr:RecName: Full=Uncharacterized protein L684 [Acanthamoeba polyphaga mimivirus]AHA45153.1 hypothetical protein HIRU_S247 [Hirudovirus strain Sangsue]AMZ03127.1 uncharacterized protein L684 [Mimivirus Bombay]BAV61812.1 uncharacterized protein L684 [Acanthamoeba castellanii mimivirus]AAV50945.1 unknown [Acanthamoeba polyphaga mimivirus]AEJ34926.1 hypothetical protein MIMI_L684 [Acanthamoeba polyphaga mimivirus]
MPKILSYNVFFKSMLTDPVYNYCKPIIKNNGLEYTTCLYNVSKFIASQKDLDFVLLQEATNWKTLQKITLNLSQMETISTCFDVEIIVTFYNKQKYQLDPIDNMFIGYMDSVNRPFHVLFFQNNICLINLHAGHKGDIYFLDKYLVRSLKKLDNYQKFIDKLTTYDIIIGGDFNDELKIDFYILSDNFFGISEGRRLYGNTFEPSCCNPVLNYLGRTKKSYDHILSTLNDNVSTVIPVVKASDHMPIISTITKNIGFDFDGVLHLDVNKPDYEGQRNPYNLIGPYNIFNNIINLILKEILDNNNVYIITARKDTKVNRSVINSHLKKTILKNYINKIPILFSGGKDKTLLLTKYNINTFYDDSCLRINELFLSKILGNLSNLNQLYFVDPDNQSYQLVTKQNINKLCGNFINKNIISLLDQSDNTHNNSNIKLISTFIDFNHNYQFRNPDINYLMKELNDIINENNLDYHQIDYIDKLQDSIVKMIIKELKQNINNLK